MDHQTMARWFAELPEGPCRAAVAEEMEALLDCEVSVEYALEQCIAKN